MTFLDANPIGSTLVCLKRKRERERRKRERERETSNRKTSRNRTPNAKTPNAKRFKRRFKHTKILSAGTLSLSRA